MISIAIPWQPDQKLLVIEETSSVDAVVQEIRKLPFFENCKYPVRLCSSAEIDLQARQDADSLLLSLDTNYKRHFLSISQPDDAVFAADELSSNLLCMECCSDDLVEHWGLDHICIAQALEKKNGIFIFMLFKEPQCILTIKQFMEQRFKYTFVATRPGSAHDAAKLMQQEDCLSINVGAKGSKSVSCATLDKSHRTHLRMARGFSSFWCKECSGYHLSPCMECGLSSRIVCKTARCPVFKRWHNEKAMICLGCGQGLCCSFKCMRLHKCPNKSDVFEIRTNLITGQKWKECGPKPGYPLTAKMIEDIVPIVGMEGLKAKPVATTTESSSFEEFQVVATALLASATPGNYFMCIVRPKGCAPQRWLAVYGRPKDFKRAVDVCKSLQESSEAREYCSSVLSSISKYKI